ncbi:MAG: prepilin-type N-terminal cleavage/methylation domain-containing protein [Fibrobacteria bacterium]
MNPVRTGLSPGFSLLELVVVLGVLGLLASGASVFLGQKFGEKEKIRSEARGLVDDLLELRAKAVTGMKNPCLDFPDATTIRMYSDSSTVPNGYQAGADLSLRTRLLSGGVRASVSGGQGPTHIVCFESRGIAGSAGSALLVTFQRSNQIYARKVRLLPATGMAKVL